MLRHATEVHKDKASNESISSSSNNLFSCPTDRLIFSLCQTLPLICSPMTSCIGCRSRDEWGFKVACLVHQSLTSTALMTLSADIHLISKHGHHHYFHSHSYWHSLCTDVYRIWQQRFAVTGTPLSNIWPVMDRLRRCLKGQIFRA